LDFPTSSYGQSKFSLNKYTAEKTEAFKSGLPKFMKRPSGIYEQAPDSRNVYE